MSETTMTETEPRIHRCAKHPDKIQYREVGEAFAAVERARARRNVELHVYACRHCGFYHLTKQGGDNIIGPEVLDLPVYTTETTTTHPPIRDVLSNEQKVLRALTDMGDPTTVRARDVAPLAGMKRDRVTETLRKMGWERTGATKSIRWNRPGTTPDTPARFIAETLREANGTAPATEVIAAGLAHGFTEGELVYARESMTDPRVRAVMTLGGHWHWRIQDEGVTPARKKRVPHKTQPDRLPLGDIGDLTLDQIRRAADAFGVSIEIEVTIWDRKGPGR